MIIEISMICITLLLFGQGFFNVWKEEINLKYKKSPLHDKMLEEALERISNLESTLIGQPFDYESLLGKHEYPPNDRQTPDQQEVTDNPSDEELITNEYDGLGSDYLIEINAELDDRIESIKKELEYEERQKEKIEQAKASFVISEDADALAKELARKTKEEYAK